MSSLNEQLVKYISDNGPITFRDFMESSLYDENFGYYTSKKPNKKFGYTNDYFTSPHAHPTFGLLIAIFLKNIHVLMGKKDNFTVIEHGSGDGILARDVIEFSRMINKTFGKSLNYLAIDKTPECNTFQEIKTYEAISNIRADVYLSNELIDSIPVHRFVIRASQLKEIFVDVKDGALVQKEGPVSDTEIFRRVQPFIPNLPNGYMGEVCVAYENWAREVRGLVESGIVISIDYGHNIEKLYTPERRGGLLRCYNGHNMNQNPYLNPGSQDITSHVDFSSLNEALGKVGFVKIANYSQKTFLEQLGIHNFAKDVIKKFKSNHINVKSLQENLEGILTLVEENGLGSFQIYIHSTPDLSSLLVKKLDQLTMPVKDLNCPLTSSQRDYVNFLSSPYKKSGFLPQKSWEELF
ncbi:MAG: SAM-dependent methyltransferase [Dehalococcoidia bacterium]|nr:hypothetical protein [Chloroflexota bacterium]MDP6425686.1 SAM-dependent methyltransferase [Dehalococcoidia bacterium]MDP7231537.1 SAM-dependent methyltransferase [Dehalococcoidia bacterium]MDP7613160.1 SAM-dependent methyltransferase [Dehalococcoidia bacterium]